MSFHLVTISWKLIIHQPCGYWEQLWLLKNSLNGIVFLKSARKAAWVPGYTLQQEAGVGAWGWTGRRGRWFPRLISPLVCASGVCWVRGGLFVFSDPKCISFCEFFQLPSEPLWTFSARSIPVVLGGFPAAPRSVWELFTSVSLHCYHLKDPLWAADEGEGQRKDFRDTGKRQWNAEYRVKTDRNC